MIDLLHAITLVKLDHRYARQDGNARDRRPACSSSGRQFTLYLPQGIVGSGRALSGSWIAIV
jgi:hypothetical protein